MSRTIHGYSHHTLKHFRANPAALAVFWVYVSRMNKDNVAWPSVRGLGRDTGWSDKACHKARAWLVEHQALERVEGYIRPEWQTLPEQTRAQLLNLDKAEYYRPTGTITIEGQVLSLLYVGGKEQGDPPLLGHEGTDVVPRATSNNSVIAKSHVVPGSVSERGTTELNTIKESELDSTPNASSNEDALDHAPANAEQVEAQPPKKKSDWQPKFSPGQSVWVESDKDRIYHTCTVVRETRCMVEVLWTNGTSTKQFRRAKANVYTEKPNHYTISDLTPLQAVIGTYSLGLQPGEEFGNGTFKAINQIVGYMQSELLNGAYPDADELRQAYQWRMQTTSAPKNLDAVVKMVRDYRGEHQHREDKPPTPSPHQLARPDCPRCGGNGVFKDADGQIKRCECIQVVTNG
jgi:hypothetical protein